MLAVGVRNETMRLGSRAPLAAALALLAFPAPASHASFPGPNGPIALTQFATDRGNQDSSYIQLISSRGRDLGRGAQCTVAAPVACPYSPSFSPDGSRLAYHSIISSGPIPFAVSDHLVISKVDGSGRVDLPVLTEGDTQPVWSPDGSRLVFTGLHSNAGKLDLYVVRADGTGLRRLTRRGGSSAAWSSRNRIAYVRDDSLRIVRPDGTSGRRVATGRNPDWSPSGRSLAYDLRGRTYTLAVRGSRAPRARRRLVRRGFQRPVWSPDGRLLAVLRPGGDVPADLFVIRSDGTRLRRIYRSRAPDDTSFDSVLDAAWGRHLSVIPD